MSFIQPITLSPACQQSPKIQYELDIYRGDLEHPNAPGNKWHKLQHHLKAAEKQNASVIATFGGPFSNHLHAFGMTLRTLPFKAVAVVRGELQPQLTPTLSDMVEDGVELWPSLRSDYRLGMDSQIVSEINKHHDNVYWVPEGGGGGLGAMGCHDWANNISAINDKYDAWVVSSGTGTTAAGFLSNINTPDLHILSALKGEPAQRCLILDLASKLAAESMSKESLDTKLFFHSDCHEGGYAKQSPALIAFMREFSQLNPSYPLDPIYTSKSMFAIFNAMKEGAWPYRRTLFIHTGGLQGWRGYSKDTNPYACS
ncbi:1-aminocyclopropane-1-carboxylate deaminase/D-cysteine desulfhydrase [Marinomonas sp. BSi20584]|uniref:1-aminocyclopropane-1-carboxylate deaminase/D-cysteine desulfhydrase n=1 Tax=Marinomonas sp. BSi20584 TaxID=1594462 RepID=UPI000C1F2FCF|nr:cysteine desulfhydrase [Marinomonas sp. BSi20584]PJE56938.1 cysteine desulfhydrase [Marinomonas sp. BSi20584]